MNRTLSKILIVSDLHGSNACFKKCVAMVKETSPNVLVVAGDFLGKSIAKFRRNDDGSTEYFPRKGARQILTEDVFVKLKNSWSDSGVYPVEVTELGDESTDEELQTSAGIRRLTQWLDYGHQAFPDLQVVAIPGNDDPDALVEVLQTHPWVKNVDGRIVCIHGYEFLGLGYSNETPWETPRELTEEEIAEKLKELSGKVTNPRRTIAVVHIPPRDSNLDLAPNLERLPDGTLQITGTGYSACGSSAVRQFIETFSPLLLICGHCHSSGGVARIDHTLCVNPGSTFQRGLLLARVVVLDGETIVGEQRLAR